MWLSRRPDGIARGAIKLGPLHPGETQQAEVDAEKVPRRVILSEAKNLSSV